MAVHWERPVEVGQWGGVNGNGWDDGHFTSIRKIVLRHGFCINSIQVEYDANGSSVWRGQHGGNGGGEDVITFNYQETLISISGYIGAFHYPCVIKSLKFETNMRKYGPFGSEKGMYFSLPVMGGKIVGFYGKSGIFLDSIGVYYKPLRIIYKQPQLRTAAKNHAQKEP